MTATCPRQPSVSQREILGTAVRDEKAGEERGVENKAEAALRSFA